MSESQDRPSSPRPEAGQSSSMAEQAESHFDVGGTAYDNVCLLIVCKYCDDGKILLTRGNTKFFPHVPIRQHLSWYDNALEGTVNFLAPATTAEQMDNYRQKLPFEQFMMLHILRLQQPQSQRFLTRVIYLVVLDPDVKAIKCCQDSSTLRWFPLALVASAKVAQVWGPEVSYFTNALRNKVEGTITEYSLNDAFTYILFDHPPGSNQQTQATLLKDLTEADAERFYADYIEHCFPSFFMTRDSFLVYMKRHEIECRINVINRYYVAFRTRGKHYMQFTELMLGLGALDPRTPHVDARIKLVFRYYDFNRDNYLDFWEFKRMLDHMQAPAKPSDSLVREEMEKMGAVQVGGVEVVTFEQFRQAVAQRTFRGTSRLCRAGESPFGLVTRSLATRRLCKPFTASSIKGLLLNKAKKKKCHSCAPKRSGYEINSSLVFLDHRGRCAKFKQILPGSISRYSLEITFNSDSIFHLLLNSLRFFNKEKGTPSNFKGLFSEYPQREKEIFFEHLKRICKDVARLVENEDRVLQVADPAYVIGDIHGNLEDLLTLEQALWPRVPLLSCNYLFLGDYVDRGRWGFECFLYLMLLKTLCPRKVWLLRGNHEVRVIQQKYSFHKELTSKYGRERGQEIFELYNYVFDRLPCCAVVSGAIFCVHGGLPCTKRDLVEINKNTSHTILNPESEAPAVWEMLWSDPLEYAKFGEAACALSLEISPDDFTCHYLPNAKRGTAYLFNEYATESFLQQNGLQYMIRAHEVPAVGYRFDFGRLCTTIFSCSHYCRNENEAAVAQITRDGRIRVVRIDTTNNKCAME